jgi:hypothetical protein
LSKTGNEFLVKLQLPLSSSLFSQKKYIFKKIPVPKPIVLDLVLLSIPGSGIKTKIETRIVFD